MVVFLHMVDKKQLVYHLLSLIPRGKVVTYGEISQFLKINSARAVGQILHQNKNPKIACFKVVFADGSLSKSYGFGGEEEQMRKLKKEGISFLTKQSLHGRTKIVNIVNLEKHRFRLSKVLKIYFQFLKKFGFPGPWPWFQDRLRRDGQLQPHSKEEIVIGAILTQNTNWRNVEKALNNLRKKKANNLEKIYKLGKNGLDELKKLIRTSGFYNQKAERLWRLSKFIIENYQNLENFFRLPIDKAREKLLSLNGIGEETADTILLYAGKKPIFVIDGYTRRFVEAYLNLKGVPSRHDRTEMVTYEVLQKYFSDNLPLNVKLFQDYHALIVRWGKTDKNIRV